MRARIIAVVLLILGLRAQGSVAQGPGPIRMGTSSFIVARYSFKGASSLYAGYAMGPAGLFIAAVINPKSGYHELVGGVFTTVSYAEHGVTVGFAAADASDGQYLQTYVVPSLVAGPFQLSGTIEWYEPLSESGVRQLDVNPVTLALGVGGNLKVGAAFTESLAEGSESSERLGPVVQLGIPRGQVYVEYLYRFQPETTEIRVGTQLAF